MQPDELARKLKERYGDRAELTLRKMEAIGMMAQLMYHLHPAMLDDLGRDLSELIDTAVQLGETHTQVGF